MQGLKDKNSRLNSLQEGEDDVIPHGQAHKNPNPNLGLKKVMKDMEQVAI